MAGRIEPRKLLRRRALFLGLALILLSFGLFLPSCRNPLMDIIDYSNIIVKVEGVTVKAGGSHDLGRVQRGSTYTLTFTVQNSGNSTLRLTGSPLVRFVGDPETASMLAITEAPAAQLAVRGTTSFTVRFSPVGEDGAREIQVLIANNSKTEDFVFDLPSFIDGTPPTVRVINTVPQVSPANLATNVSTDKIVWVEFSEAMDPTSITAASFTLTKVSPSTPVTASVTYNPATHIAYLDPLSLLEDTANYEAKVLVTVTDLVGNPMVLEYKWSFTTGTGVVDTEPPQVVSTVPVNNATGVSRTSAISATFTEPLSASSAVPANFLVAGTTAVSGTVGLSNGNKTITFTPAAPGLDSLTTYQVQLTTGIRDVAGNPLASLYEWSFTTEQGADTTGPTVVARNPAPGATAPTNTVITAEFNELVDPLTINSSTFSLAEMVGPSPGAKSGSVTYNSYSKTAIFTPSSTLDANSTYRATLTTGIQDIIGNPMAAQVQWLFYTGASADNTPPTVSATNPADGGTGALLYGNISAIFSESMSPASLSTTTFQLFLGTDQITGTVSYSEATKTATFNPTPLLAATEVYTAKVIGGASGAKDAAGNALEADKVWTFTTEAGTTNPTVVVGTLNPANGAVSVDIETPIQVEFSKMMDPDTITITSNTFLVAKNSGGAVTAASITYNETTRIATFTPAAPLGYSTVYRVDCTAGMTDIGGNPLIAYSYLFETMPDNLWDSMRWDFGKWAP